MMKTAFSRFKNTPDNPVLLDEDEGNSVPLGNGNVKEVEIDNQAMPMEVPVDSLTETKGERNGKEGELENRAIPMNVVVDSSTETEGERNGKQGELENRAIPMNVVVDSSTETEGELNGKQGELENRAIPMNVAVDSSTETEGVESLMADLKMNDCECIDKDTSGPKPMKERKETVDSIRGSPSSTKNTKNDFFQVVSTSKVTRSQRRKQLEEERARKESGLQPPNMGAHNVAPVKSFLFLIGSRVGSHTRTGMKTDETINETKAKDDMPTMMDEGSSRSTMPRVNVLRTRTFPRTLFDTIKDT
ncbi:hypothetical protein L6452_33130 [Arctium lappa]|uniref:Uncharacterized protein n=1 Tax=Arctium lappa TaxID=4217 RepID=A0ACB8Z7F8_ARCLA|nr:hypothetical protein L6452_33130 [Arctium lappa]